LRKTDNHTTLVHRKTDSPIVTTLQFAKVTFAGLCGRPDCATLQWTMSAAKTARAREPRIKKEEARRWERHSTSIPVDVTVILNGERFNHRGEASDISRGGMRLFLPRELDPGASLTLEFQIPYQAVKFNLCGVIRNRAGFNHGVEFINATRYQEEMIDRTCKVFDLLR